MCNGQAVGEVGEADAAVSLFEWPVFNGDDVGNALVKEATQIETMIESQLNCHFGVNEIKKIQWNKTKEIEFKIKKLKKK